MSASSRGSTRPTIGLAGRGAVDPERRGELGADQRAGHERAPELLEHQRRLGHPEAEATVGFGEAQREHAGLAELAPPLAVEPAPASSMPRTHVEA